MPNMCSDGFLDQAMFATFASSAPVNLDFQFQNAVASAIATQALLGAGTARSCTVACASYTAANANDATQRNDLIVRMMERLVNMGYGATLSGTTLTVTWP